MFTLISWWIVMLIFGLAALPLARRMFAWLPDRGYAFSKIVGLLLVSYLVWLGASLGLMVNNGGGVLLALLLTAAASALAAAPWRATDGDETTRKRLAAWWRKERAHILTVEALFLVVFAGWALVRAYAPDKILPAGGEKYMEIGFLNAILNSPTFPPLDMWMSGYSISYYYFGYVMMGVLTTASAAAPTVAFDLYDALLFALTVLGAFGVVSNMVSAAANLRDGAARGYGLLGGLFVAGLGNLEGLLEGLYSSRALPDAFWTWIDIPDLAGSPQSGSFFLNSGWWWWRASRVLRDRDLTGQPVVFQPIDEFPFFSFLLGDNHPHKLALPFILLAVGLAFNLLLKAAGEQRRAGVLETLRANAGLYLFAALSLGAVGFLNTWDLPIYLVVVVLADAAGCWWSARRSEAGPVFGLVLRRAAALAMTLGAAAILLYIFFYLGFSSQAGGVLPYVFQPTRLAQWLVMFGPFAFILAVFLSAAVERSGWTHVLRAWLWIAGLAAGGYILALLLGAAAINLTSLKDNPILQSWMGGMSAGEGLARILAAKAASPWLFLALSAVLALAAASALGRLQGNGEFLPDREREPAAVGEHPGGSPAADLPVIFACLLAFCGVGLTLVVEFFYLRDNFGMRMNTIFKFYFQGWVMMACASAFGVWWARKHLQTAARGGFSLAAAALVAAALVYPVMAVASRTERFSGQPNLDAAASFNGFYPGHWAAQPDDWAAIQWLRENATLPDGSVPTLLEAGGGGYENAGRISVFTGFPTVLGWTNHEGQWRGSQEEINRRSPDIVTIYTTPSAETALDLLDKWGVDYVIAGETEQQYVARLCAEAASPCSPDRAWAKFRQAFVPVFAQGGTTIYRVPARVEKP